MKDEGTATMAAKKESSESSLLRRGRYKFCALAAILLLAFWSIFTGTVTLKWSAGNLTRFSEDINSPIREDLDVLELENREKVVRQMWDVYRHSGRNRMRLVRFWQEAFHAAFEDLTSGVVSVRNAAISEIARMSMHAIDLQPPAAHSKSNGEKQNRVPSKQGRRQ